MLHNDRKRVTYMKLIPLDQIRYYSITHDNVTFTAVALKDEIEKMPFIETTTNLMGDYKDFICCECDYISEDSDYNYCPNCGRLITKENSIKVGEKI